MERQNSDTTSTSNLHTQSKQSAPSRNRETWLLDGWQMYFDPKYEKPDTFDPQGDPRQNPLLTFYHLLTSNPNFPTLFTPIKTQPHPPSSSSRPNPNLIFSTDFQLLSDFILNSPPDNNNNNKLLKDLFISFDTQSTTLLPSLQLALWHFTKPKHPHSKQLFLELRNFTPIKEITEIKAHQVSHFITINSIVLKVFPRRAQFLSMAYLCRKCSGEFKHYFSNGIFTHPSKCKATMNCPSKIFDHRKESLEVCLVQRVKVKDNNCEGSKAVELEVELRDHLVNRVISGETVSISGVLMSLDEISDRGRQAIFTPVLLANSISRIQHSLLQPSSQDSIIRKMRSDKHIFDSLIRSFCPAIFGHQQAKAGILLSLASYSKHPSCKPSTRGSHLLLLGDPGLGKSQLLQFSSSLLPNSLYVVGTTLSSNGLTAIVTNTDSGPALEAGALVLCDQGICAIDQFGKISDNSAILEVSEQQTVSVAKAGIVCQLQARATIIASANPHSGNFNKNTTLKQNIKISNAVLSRFDLIFLMIDTPNEVYDRVVSDHIVSMHRRGNKQTCSQMLQGIDPESLRKDEDAEFLTYKIGSRARTNGVLYSKEEMSAYLGYVRESVAMPTLSPEAAEIIKTFFLGMRSNPPSKDLPVTIRQLQSIIRLCLSRARLECSPIVTQAHTLQTIKLIQQCLYDSLQKLSSLGPKAKPKRDTNTKPLGQQSLPKQTKGFLGRLKQIAESEGQTVFSIQELQFIASELQMKVMDFHGYVESLNIQGFFLLQAGKYRLVVKNLMI